ncbi:MAG: MFS transporter [Pirellulales bacterium]|nr:MFS transporter [Pirellulales bacterium]
MATQELAEQPVGPALQPPERLSPATTEPSLYGRSFWMAFGANLCATAVMALLFRFSDFVTHLGGTEADLGYIVGVGMIGALCMRLAQGLGVDRFGPRRVWLLSLVLLAAASVGHLAIQSLHDPSVYLLQIAIRTALAGAFGASITYISYQVPAARTVEVLGSLGSSGFVGIMLGTALGDFVSGGEYVTRSHVDAMFVLCTALALAGTFFAWQATTNPVRPPQRQLPPLIPVIMRFHPGVLLLVALAIGIGLGMPGVFVRPFGEEQGITVLAWFFWTYAPTAFAVRLMTRRFSSIYGVRPMILSGLASAVIGSLSLMLVSRGWHFMLPGFFFGFCHALIFPSVTGAGSMRFPARYRGIGVALILAMFDLGNLIGAPLGGSLHEMAVRYDLPTWPIVFSTFAGLLLTIAVTYAVVSGRSQTRPTRRKNRSLRQKSKLDCQLR